VDRAVFYLVEEKTFLIIFRRDKMTEYDFRYQLEALEAKNDGTGVIKHQTAAVSRPSDALPEDGWSVIGGRRKEIQIHHVDLAVVNAMDPGAARNQAYKALLVSSLNSTFEPVLGWDGDSLALFMAENDAAMSVCEDAVAYLATIGAFNFPENPIPFNV